MVDTKHKAKFLLLEDVAKIPATKKEFVVRGSPSEKNEFRIIGDTGKLLLIGSGADREQERVSPTRLHSNLLLL